MRNKTLLLTIISVFYATEHAYSWNFANFISQASKVVQNGVQQNPQLQQDVQFLQQQAQSLGNQQLSNAQNYFQKNIQEGLQNAYGSGGIGGSINYLENQAGGFLNNQITLAKQQQGTLQTAYQQDQINQAIQSLTDMDKQYGAQVQTLNPQWKAFYVQVQKDLVSAPVGYAPVINYLVDLSQRIVRIIPVLVAQNGALNPSDARWVYLVDKSGNLLGLDGKQLPPPPAPPANGCAWVTTPVSTTPPASLPVMPASLPVMPVAPQVPAPVALTQADVNTVLQNLFAIDNQYGVTLWTTIKDASGQPIGQTIRTQYFNTYSQLGSMALTDPKLPGLVALAKRQIQAVPTLIQAKGGLIPSDQNWTNLKDAQENIYMLDGTKASVKN